MDTKIPKSAGAASDGARFRKVSRRGGDRVVDRGLRGGRLDGGGLVDDGGGAGDVASEHEADFGGLDRNLPHPNPLPEGEGTKGKGFRANVVEVQLEIDRDSDFEELVNSRLKVRHRTRGF